MILININVIIHFTQLIKEIIMELKNLLLERSLRFNMKDVSIEDLIKIRDHFNKII